MHACMQKCKEELLSLNAKEGSKENLLFSTVCIHAYLQKWLLFEALIGFTR